MSHYHVSLNGHLFLAPTYAKHEKQEAWRDAVIWRKGGTRAVVVSCSEKGCERHGMQLVEASPEKDEP